jgi:hypothetical protein
MTAFSGTDNPAVFHPVYFRRIEYINGEVLRKE